jgi:nucleoside-diphosphate-sugar epimerase
VMNVACGAKYSLLELHRKLCELTGQRVEPVFAPQRAGDVKHSLASIEQVQRTLGYAPQVDWRSGLRWTVDALMQVQRSY